MNLKECKNCRDLTYVNLLGYCSVCEEFCCHDL